MAALRFIAIAAISENRAIGQGGRIPWYITEDFRHFKDTTFGYPIIMGRKTYESIGRPLPGRENIVLSRSETNFPGTTSITNLESLKKYLGETGKEKAFVCGGSEIYQLFFQEDLIDEVVLSRIPMLIVDADAFFPEFEGSFQRKRVDKKQEFSIEYWVHN